MKLEFYRQIFETSSSMKIRPVGTELFHADGQIGVPKLIVAFLCFANEPTERFFRMERDSPPVVWNTYESNV